MSRDTWYQRDEPVLVAVATMLDADPGTPLRSQALADETGLDFNEVLAALVALDRTYIVGDQQRSMNGLDDFGVTGLTERGRRAAGLWPSGDSADDLVALLRDAEASTDDPEEKSLLRRAAGALGSISRDITTDVMAAFIKAHTGMS